jgi:hypothetical protein
MVVRVVVGTPWLRWWLPFRALHCDLQPRRARVQTRRGIVGAVLSLG